MCQIGNPGPYDVKYVFHKSNADAAYDIVLNDVMLQLWYIYYTAKLFQHDTYIKY